MTNGQLLLSVSDFAQKIGVSRPTAYRLLKRGVIPAISIGGITRIPARAIDELIERKLAERESVGTAKEARVE